MRDSTQLEFSEFLGEEVVHTFHTQPSGFETCWQWPKETGRGTTHLIKLRPGLDLGITKLQIQKDTTISFDLSQYPLTFGYGVAGTVTYSVELKDGNKGCVSSNPGHCFACCLPKWKGETSIPGGTPLGWVSIFMSPAILRSLIHPPTRLIPKQLCDIAGGSTETQYLRMSRRTALSDLALRQMLNCPYQGTLRRLYLESKALELLTHSLAQLSQPEKMVREPFILRPQDIERVKQAGELVRQDLQHPPKLPDLAKSVGMHHSKLNFGFRKVYGVTFLNYLRQSRLRMARTLLEDGRMNVTEVAYAVGYFSLSHFAKSFKDTFGTTPSTYLRTAASKR